MWAGSASAEACAGVAKWLKAQGLGPCHEGVRGFDSRPPHQRSEYLEIVEWII